MTLGSGKVCMVPFRNGYLLGYDGANPSVVTWRMGTVLRRLGDVYEEDKRKAFAI